MVPAGRAEPTGQEVRQNGPWKEVVHPPRAKNSGAGGPRRITTPAEVL